MFLHFHDPRTNTRQPFRSILQLASLVCVALMHSQPNLHILISNIVSQRACPNSVLDKTVPCLFVFWLMRSYSVSLCLPATVSACCACFLPSSPSPPFLPSAPPRFFFRFSSLSFGSSLSPPLAVGLLSLAGFLTWLGLSASGLASLSGRWEGCRGAAG